NNNNNNNNNLVPPPDISHHHHSAIVTENTVQISPLNENKNAIKLSVTPSKNKPSQKDGNKLFDATEFNAKLDRSESGQSPSISPFRKFTSEKTNLSPSPQKRFLCAKKIVYQLAYSNKKFFFRGTDQKSDHHTLRILPYVQPDQPKKFFEKKGFQGVKASHQVLTNANHVMIFNKKKESIFQQKKKLIKRNMNNKRQQKKTSERAKISKFEIKEVPSRVCNNSSCFTVKRDKIFLNGEWCFFNFFLIASVF
ncbi:hypothetical protein RFI_11018, partial [Reticulomyxa filosa]